MVRDGEQYAETDKTRKAAIEAKNEAETAVYSSEKSLNEYKDKIPQVIQLDNLNLRLHLQHNHPPRLSTGLFPSLTGTRSVQFECFKSVGLGK